MKNILIGVLLVLVSVYASAQFPGGNRGGFQGRQMNVGHFYGKVVDEKTNKPIEFAAVQLMQNKFDSLSKSMKETMVAGELTRPNGDFSLENLPVMGEFKLKISALGYKPVEQKIVFKLKLGQGGGMQQAMNAVDKDLGNIKLSINAVMLKEATVEETLPVYEMKIDKKVYNVEKSIVNTGGTAEDVLKNVPSVNVDLDGNVTLRNAAPQLFVDGRPTTLSIDQIPADAMQSVEVITNPSAKFDASGGGAGILNIVLKKNRKVGYNGNVRAGFDSRGRGNFGADLNAREGKINFFISGMINQRKSKSTGETERSYIGGTQDIHLSQQNPSETNGYFGFGRAGIDYFIDNRNTITLAGIYNKGNFKPTDNISTVTDTIDSTGTRSSSSVRVNESERNMQNIGGTFSFKHIYPREGREWTADVNYNGSKSDNTGNYHTQNYDSNKNPSGAVVNQSQTGNGKVDFTTIQTDYVDPLNEKMKIETGMRGAIRNYSSFTENFVDNIPVISQLNDYKFNDQVYAAYFTFTNQLEKFGYQAGLRAESSFYTGELTDSHQSFTHQYPVNFFPSAFLSYKLNEKNSLQLNYSRRINRPNFFQLLPYIDYSDSLNLSRGNPDLKPEFTNSMELSWQKTFNRKNTLITSVYFKNTNDLITRFQSRDYSLANHPIISTYENANSSYAYGMEITSQNSFNKWLDVSMNINAYNSNINGTNLQENLTNQQFSWIAKLNSTFRLPKNFSIQLSGDYHSKTALQVGGGGGGGRGFGGGGGMGGFGGGGGFYGGSSSTAQGYVKPFLDVDAGMKFEFLKNRAASITVNVNDIFNTRKNETYSESPFFTQTTMRKRDSQIFRVNFSYRFGKFDVSLFKRKNTRMENIDIPDAQ
ncbi:MAG: TonB-dependent receptor [Bacteroidetes bacterium]|nr:TonB-dependent receptor [Bacteroidota bacterium]